jgi:rare lipoprotein A (peptidoglycan hydrolase)
MTGTESLKFYRTGLSIAAASIAAGATILLSASAADAGGWATVHKFVKRSGTCAGQEVLASHYASGKRTATGERFDANGNTAAARTWALGTHLTVTNPKTGRSLTVRINDRGPYGIAYAQGARLDLARGAAHRLGMSGAQYVCVTEGGGSTVTASAAKRRDTDGSGGIEHEMLARSEPATH